MTLPSDGPSSGYEIAFQRGSIYLRNCKTQSFLGSTNAQALMENDRARIEIRASLKSGKVCLLVNDRADRSLDGSGGRRKASSAGACTLWP